VKKGLIALISLLVIASGCGPQKSPGTTQAGEGSVPKSFFARTITYTVDPGAKEYMLKLENLLARAKKLEMPLPDDVVLPLYRDADVNRDHHISAKEAEIFYKDYVLRFEDSLGAVTQ
jgi:hypothetical protein